ncbi:MAG: hypothetical protein U5K79_24305 [Cyclobacteriaceae bacterium]|nr:hypothetical protein [Cyclobacteriaceae bacterium]
MITRLLALVLSALMVFQSFEKVSVLIYYQTYKDYIAANLCVNRFNPESTCNGQCYLMKKLRKAEERSQTPVAPDNQKSEFVQSESIAIYLEEYTSEVSRRPVIPSLHAGDFHGIIFHPPIFTI